MEYIGLCKNSERSDKTESSYHSIEEQDKSKEPKKPFLGIGQH